MAPTDGDGAKGSQTECSVGDTVSGNRQINDQPDCRASSQAEGQATKEKIEIPKLSCPEEVSLAPSGVADGIGIFSCKRVEAGHLFGPFEGEVIFNNPHHVEDNGSALKMDHRYVWEVLDEDSDEVLFFINGDSVHGNWMRYVQCARFFEEQNIVTIQEDLNIYYKVIKSVGPNQELLTFYDKNQWKTRRGNRNKRRTTASPRRTATPPRLCTPQRTSLSRSAKTHRPHYTDSEDSLDDDDDDDDAVRVSTPEDSSPPSSPRCRATLQTSGWKQRHRPLRTPLQVSAESSQRRNGDYEMDDDGKRENDDDIVDVVKVGGSSDSDSDYATHHSSASSRTDRSGENSDYRNSPDVIALTGESDSEDSAPAVMALMGQGKIIFLEDCVVNNRATEKKVTETEEMSMTEERKLLINEKELIKNVSLSNFVKDETPMELVKTDMDESPAAEEPVKTAEEASKKETNQKIGEIVEESMAALVELVAKKANLENSISEEMKEKKVESRLEKKEGTKEEFVLAGDKETAEETAEKNKRELNLSAEQSSWTSSADDVNFGFEDSISGSQSFFENNHILEANFAYQGGAQKISTSDYGSRKGYLTTTNVDDGSSGLERPNNQDRTSAELPFQRGRVETLNEGNGGIDLSPTKSCRVTAELQPLIPAMLSSPSSPSALKFSVKSDDTISDTRATTTSSISQVSLSLTETAGVFTRDPYDFDEPDSPALLAPIAVTASSSLLTSPDPSTTSPRCLQSRLHKFPSENTFWNKNQADVEDDTHPATYRKARSDAEAVPSEASKLEPKAMTVPCISPEKSKSQEINNHSSFERDKLPDQIDETSDSPFEIKVVDFSGATIKSVEMEDNSCLVSKEKMKFEKNDHKPKDESQLFTVNKKTKSDQKASPKESKQHFKIEIKTNDSLESTRSPPLFVQQTFSILSAEDFDTEEDEDLSRCNSPTQIEGAESDQKKWSAHQTSPKDAVKEGSAEKATLSNDYDKHDEADGEVEKTNEPCDEQFSKLVCSTVSKVEDSILNKIIFQVDTDFKVFPKLIVEDQKSSKLDEKATKPRVLDCLKSDEVEDNPIEILGSIEELELTGKENCGEDSPASNRAIELSSRRSKRSAGVLHPIKSSASDKSVSAVPRKKRRRNVVASGKFNFSPVEDLHVIKKGRNKRFRCDVCLYTYKRCESLKKHYLKYHIHPKYRPETENVASKLDDSVLDNIENKEVAEEKASGVQESMPGLYYCHVCEVEYNEAPILKDHLFKTHAQLETEMVNKTDLSREEKSDFAKGEEFMKLKRRERELGTERVTYETSETEDMRCKICLISFENRAQLKKHIKFIHENSIFRCQFCQKKYFHQKFLSEHVNCFHSFGIANLSLIDSSETNLDEKNGKPLLQTQNSFETIEDIKSISDAQEIIKCPIETDSSSWKLEHNDNKYAMNQSCISISEVRQDYYENQTPNDINSFSNINLIIAQNLAHSMHGTEEDILDYSRKIRKERQNIIQMYPPKNPRIMWTKYNFPSKFKIKGGKILFDIKPHSTTKSKIEQFCLDSFRQAEANIYAEVETLMMDILEKTENSFKKTNGEKDRYNSDQWDQEKQNEDFFLSNFLQLHRNKPKEKFSQETENVLKSFRALHEESYFMRERKYVCKVCSIAFEEKLDLWNHHKIDHSLVSVMPQRSFIEIDSSQTLPWIQTPEAKTKTSGIIANVTTLPQGGKPDNGDFRCTFCDASFRYPSKLHSHILDCASDKHYRSMRRINEAFFGVKKKKKISKHKHKKNEEGLLIIKKRKNLSKDSVSRKKRSLKTSSSAQRVLRTLRNRNKENSLGENMSTDLHCQKCKKKFAALSVLSRHKILCKGKNASDINQNLGQKGFMKHRGAFTTLNRNRNIHKEIRPRKSRSEKTESQNELKLNVATKGNPIENIVVDVLQIAKVDEISTETILPSLPTCFKCGNHKTRRHDCTAVKKQKQVIKNSSYFHDEDDEDTIEAFLESKTSGESRKVQTSTGKKENEMTFGSTTCKDCNETFLSPYLFVLHQSTCRLEKQTKINTSRNKRLSKNNDSLLKIYKKHKKGNAKSKATSSWERLEAASKIMKQNHMHRRGLLQTKIKDHLKVKRKTSKVNWK